MALELTDKLIAEVDSAFNILSQKLLGVQDDIQYRAITGTNGFNDPKLTGETKRVVDEAQATVSAIWIVVNLVAKRLEEVKAKRAGVKTGLFSGASTAARELEEQLAEHNLLVADDIADKMPASFRKLIISQQAGRTSVKSALEVCSAQLKVAALAIIGVDECMSALKAQIADTEAKLAVVLPVVTKIGGAPALAHSKAIAALATTRSSYEHDPLGVRKTFDQVVGQHLNAINSALDGVNRARDKAHSHLGDARVLMQRLEDKQPSPPRTPELRDWLAKLSARIDQEEWATASQGLEDWIKEASSVLSIKPPAPSYQPPPERTPAPPVPPSQPPSGQTDSGRVHHDQTAYVPHYPPVQQGGYQVPVSGDYQKYVPKEKSGLEKILDGDVPTSADTVPAPPPKPVDPALEKLVDSHTPPKDAGQPKPSTLPNAALEDLVNGHGHPPHHTAETGNHGSTGTPVTPPSNAALDALVNKPARSDKSGDGHTVPGQTSGGALEDLIEGRPVSGKPGADKTVAAPPTGTTTTTSAPSQGQDSSRLAELLDERKKVPPPSPPAKDATPTATSQDALKDVLEGKPSKGKAKTETAGPAVKPTKAEEDEAARKALENLLKG